MEWTKIEDRLPDLHGKKDTSDEYNCLVVRDDNRVHEASRMVVIGTNGKGVKYWSPMPEPPVGSSHGG